MVKLILISLSLIDDNTLRDDNDVETRYYRRYIVD
jgi:hypothetical protein